MKLQVVLLEELTLGCRRFADDYRKEKASNIPFFSKGAQNAWKSITPHHAPWTTTSAHCEDQASAHG